ncbi:hypothetical protein T440DRAFT_93153 [Plenodomus tracheiphilus IPT5]|uniref:Uncharacterized protein n=1 Tax=Plenodomus tracheiphilus IPT5 TaxID=1408161 RepID=A0A6A7BM97_9PLEO|nr:hypothetical protein T440DRAFT_93153 [Plenodomus tracheiphilus IPT5]
MCIVVANGRCMAGRLQGGMSAVPMAAEQGSAGGTDRTGQDRTGQGNTVRWCLQHAQHEHALSVSLTHTVSLSQSGQVRSERARARASERDEGCSQRPEGGQREGVANSDLPSGRRRRRRIRPGAGRDLGGHLGSRCSLQFQRVRDNRAKENARLAMPCSSAAVRVCRAWCGDGGSRCKTRWA